MTLGGTRGLFPSRGNSGKLIVADRVELAFARSAIRVTEPSVPAKLGEVRRDRRAALRIGRANEDVGKSIRAFGVHRFGPFIYGPRRVQRRGSFAIRDYPG
jgi:hypothetical protein